MSLIYKHTTREPPAGQGDRIQSDSAGPATAPCPVAEQYRHFLMLRVGDVFVSSSLTNTQSVFILLYHKKKDLAIH